MSNQDLTCHQTQFFQGKIMKDQRVEQVELFSEAELKSLEFIPEELEAIESKILYPDLESISFEERKIWKLI